MVVAPGGAAHDRPRLWLQAGLRADCGRSIKELRQTAALYAATAGRGDTWALRLEEVEADFERTIARLLFFVGAASDAADERQANRPRSTLAPPAIATCTASRVAAGGECGAAAAARAAARPQPHAARCDARPRASARE